MAIITAIANGNWSSPSTWGGGVLPGAGDEAEAGGFTVTVDQSITCIALENNLGGSFSLNSGVTVNANITPGSNTCVFASMGGDVTINGNLYAPTTNTYGTSASNNTVLTINGNLYAGNTGTAARALYCTGVLATINGNLYAGTASAAYFTAKNGNIINGALIASTVAALVVTTSATAKAQEFHFSSTDIAPTSGRVGLLPGGKVVFLSDNRVLEVPDYPVPAAVRNGIVYGSGQFTGTYSIPFYPLPTYSSELDVFPDLPGLAWDIKKTPTFKTLTQESLSGRESRVALMQYPLWDFSLSFNFLRESDTGLSEMRELCGFFLKQRGSFNAFFYADPDDYSIVDQQIGVGNGSATQFQLLRTFGGYTEPVMWPDSVTVRVNNIVVPHTMGNKGIVSIAPPAAAAVITWSGTYFYRCRFSEDEAEFNNFAWNLWDSKSLTFRADMGDRL